jgi:hypothetical protein
VTLRTRTAARVLALVIAAGCHEYRPARAPLQARSTVRVSFDRPRTLTVARSSGDSVRVDDVTQVEGLLRAVRGDTLDIELRSIRPGAAARTVGRRSRAAVTVVPPYERPVEVGGVSAAGTALLVTFVAAVLVIWDLSMLPRT